MPHKYTSRNRLILSIAALALLSSCSTSKGPENSTSTYLPEVDNTAILFIHKFNPADYENGKRIVVDGFSEAIQVSGQTRRTYFLSRADSSEVVAISFFHANSSSGEWLNSDVRDNVLQKLRPLYREPLELQEYHLTVVHNTHVTGDLQPEYLPKKGDEFVLFIHLFSEQGYVVGKAKVEDEFTRNIETSGQKMRSYFLDSAKDDEVAVATFVHPDSSAEAWLSSEEHLETLESLSPLHRVPLEVARYVVEAVHNAN